MRLPFEYSLASKTIFDDVREGVGGNPEK